MTQNFLLIVLICLSISVSAQFVSDKDEIHIRFAELYQQYENKLVQGAAIFHGPEYIPTNPTIKGDPTFLRKNPSYGSVVYQGHFYDSLLLSYDVIQDNLILAYQNQGLFFSIVLNSDKIDSFTLMGHYFHNVRKDTIGLNYGGFFDRLYDGPSTIMVKRRKTTRPANVKGYLFEYTESDRYFIYSQGKFNSVSTKASIYRLFEKNKKAIKREMRRVDYTYRSQRDRYLKRVCFLNDKLEG
jgi:hypothetical protein